MGVRKKLGLPSRFDLRKGDPLAVAAIAVRYPGVPFVIPHFGAGLFREALMAADVAPNIVLDTSSSNAWIKFTPGSPPDVVGYVKGFLDAAHECYPVVGAAVS